MKKDNSAELYRQMLVKADRLERVLRSNSKWNKFYYLVVDEFIWIVKIGGLGYLWWWRRVLPLFIKSSVSITGMIIKGKV